MKLLLKNNRWILLVLLGIHILISFSIQFTAWPEMFAYPWLMQNGFRLYGDIIHPYLPLLPLLLVGLFQILGFSVFSIQLITIVFFLLIDLLLFLLIRKLYTDRKASLAVLIFVALTVTPDANGLWFDLACIPFLLGALFFLNNSSKNSMRNYLIAGLSIGFAVLIKQTSIVFLVPAFFQLREKKYFPLIVLGAIVPLFLTIAIYRMTSQFNDFWYWSIIHPTFVHGRMPGFALLPNKREIIFIALLFWPVLFAFQKNLKLTLWFIFSLAFAFPRFGYFHLLPAGAFFALLLPHFFIKKLRIALLIYVAVIIFIIGNWLVTGFGKPARFFEPEVIAAREEIKAYVPSGEQALFLNVPANYFMMSSVVPTKPWADTFPWYLEVEGLQEKITANLIEVNYIVFSPYGSNGEFELGSYQPTQINQYVSDHFYPAEKLTNGFFILRRRN